MLMFGGLMMGFGAGTTAGLITYFNLHFWGLLPQQIAYLVAIAPIASLMALWLGSRLADRFGKKRAIIGLYVLWLLTAIGPISLRLLGVMPANGSALLLPILMANITMSFTLAVSCHIILGSAIADTVDDIAVKANVRSEGLMFSTYQVLAKVANGGGAFVAGAALSLVAFPTRAVPGTVATAILDELALVQMAIVVVFNVASIAFFTQYNLTREDHERNVAILAEQRGVGAQGARHVMPGGTRCQARHARGTRCQARLACAPGRGMTCLAPCALASQITPPIRCVLFRRDAAGPRRWHLAAVGTRYPCNLER
jgi:Na+/melibiose symporter-like transporter